MKNWNLIAIPPRLCSDDITFLSIDSNFGSNGAIRLVENIIQSPAFSVNKNGWRRRGTSQYVESICVADRTEEGRGGEERNPRENFVATRSNVAAE